jgi:carbon storage regulator CsrA
VGAPPERGTHLQRKESTKLKLTRRAGETIHIGDNVTVVVTAVNGSQVRLGIHAPPEVRIVRGELLARPAPDPAAA